jgi:hypothetical protein
MGEAFRHFWTSDECALALNPVDHTLVFELLKRLSNHGSGHPELLAQAMLTGQQVAWLQAEASDLIDDAPFELVVHRNWGSAFDPGCALSCPEEFVDHLKPPTQ